MGWPEVLWKGNGGFSGIDLNGPGFVSRLIGEFLRVAAFLMEPVRTNGNAAFEEEPVVARVFSVNNAGKVNGGKTVMGEPAIDARHVIIAQPGEGLESGSGQFLR